MFTDYLTNFLALKGMSDSIKKYEELREDGGLKNIKVREYINICSCSPSTDCTKNCDRKTTHCLGFEDTRPWSEEEIKKIQNPITPYYHNINTQSHYKGSTSLYKVAEDWGLNAWETDILKRIVRCRHKGQFEEDLQKTIDLINIYKKEYKP